MRGRLALGVLTVFGLLLGFTSLGLSRPPRSGVEQIGTLPPTFTQTPAPTNTSSPTSVFPTNTPIPTATSIVTGIPPTTPPGAQPTQGPKPRGEPATPGTGIKTNACARVVGAQGLVLGDAPGFSANHVQIVGRDDIVFVTEGPQRADGLWWWKVTTRESVIGWGINDQILPFGGECFGLTGGLTPSPQPTPLTAVSSGAVSGVGATATLSGTQSQLPSTGSNNNGLYVAGALAVVLLVAGLVRRRSQGTV
ncbi:MAG TPA: LPXTG cell wall anchor domain-containing protein [Anaerolineae bacterium]